MERDNVALAKEYYRLVGCKDIAGIKEYLHAEVVLRGPLATLQGKDAVVRATVNYMNMIGPLTIRAAFGKDDQAVVIYDVDIAGVAAAFPAAVLLTFRDGLIVRSELFYDGSPFVERREAIFSS